jgi:two-component system, cell cycle sensor histidine kinase and response regulator CckA
VGELVQRIIEAVPGGVVHVGIDGAVQRANAEALRILGFRFDDVTKRYIADWDPVTLHEDGSPCPLEDYPVAKVLATGKPDGPITIGIRRPDGVISWAVFRAVPVRDDAGALEGAVVTFLDITERKEQEERLRTSEQKWRFLAENLPDFVVIADRDLRIKSSNRIVPPLREEDVIGVSLLDFIDEHFRDGYRQAFAAALATRRPTRTETRRAARGLETAWFDVSFVPLGEEKGEPRVLVVARDVTAHRAMLASLAEKERLASVGMVAASVAHEIMNPLTYVLANLDFAIGDRQMDDLRRTKALAEAREGAKRMQQIVWDLRALGRAGGEELFYVDARSVLETALRLSGPEVARAARVNLDLHEVPGVLASESRLCQVFINLLVNAAQSMDDRPAAEREIGVRTRHDEAANMVAVDISDKGVGIPSDRIDRVFEPFYTTKRAGTGLGLSISKDIVERMGGRIAVESALGKGTTFTVWLSTTRIA